MMAVAVYILCVMTSTFCATLLLREFLRTRAPLLLWSSLSFAAFALNNALVFMDLVMLPSSDLSLFRTLAALLAIVLLLYGLIWDAS